MNYLTPKEKLKKVLDLCKQLGITAYNIGRNTPLNSSGVQRILNKTVTPHSKTINILYDYLMEVEITAKQKKSPKSAESISQAEEPQSKSIQEMVARQVYKTLEPLLLEILTRQQKNNHIISKNSLKIDDLKGELEAIKKCVSEIQEVIAPKK